MSAGTYALRIEQGATFRRTITWRDKTSGQPINLTGYTARAMIRASRGATGQPMASLVVAFDSDRTTGRLTLSLDATATATLTATGAAAGQRSAYAWDLEMVNGTEVTRLLEGDVTVSAEVTR